jgi:hypothetical protein
MSDNQNLARGFVAALRDAGHLPYVTKSGRFAIKLNVRPPSSPAVRHHLGPGYAYTLGFDDRPYAALAADPGYIGWLIAATAETEAANV